MDTIYLTTAQIEALYKLTRGKKNKPLIGCQLHSDASDQSAVTIDSVLASRPDCIAFASITADGTTYSWEY